MEKESVIDLTIDELRELIREVIHEEISPNWRVDRDGNLIFLFEEDYITYLTTQKGKLPSEVKAYFIDEQGFTVRYADETPKAETRKRIDNAKRRIAEGKGLSLEDVKRNLGLC